MTIFQTYFKRVLCITFVVLLTTPLFAVNTRHTDSLKNALANAKHDTVKINIHLALGEELNNVDSTKALYHFNQALKLAFLQKKPTYLTRIYCKVGDCYYYTAAWRHGIQYLHDGLKHARKNNSEKDQKNLFLCIAGLFQYQGLAKQSLPYIDSAIAHAKNATPEEKAGLYMNKGRAHYDIGEYKYAMSYYVKAQKLFEENNLYNRKYGHLLHYIGSVFKRQELYSKALVYYEKELALARKLNDKSLEAEALYLCAGMYGRLGNLDKELEFCQKSLEIYQQEKNDRAIALMFGNLSGNYSDRKDYKTAITYLEKALEIYIKSADEEKKAWVYRSLGDNYSKMNQHKKAIPYFQMALEANAKTETKQLLNMAEITESMAWAHARSGDHKNAFYTYLEYQKLRDSIRNEENTAYLHEVEAKYETEKKEQKIVLLNKDQARQKAELALKDVEAQNQKAQRNLLVIGCVLVLAVAGIAAWAFFNKRKDNKILSKQFEEINVKNTIIKEKNKDITDSINYAKRIQQAVLPMPEELNNFFSESFILYRPKDIVSGDFYWFSQQEDTAILAVGDCTGHGVPGAFMSIIGHDLLNQVVLEDKVHKPGEILRLLDKRVTNTLNKRGSRQEYNDGMDIAICTFYKKERKMIFSGANRPLIVKRHQEIIELPPNKFAIGGTQDTSCKLFYQHELDLEEADIVYMFSDGYHDQFGGASGKKLKYHQLKQYIKELTRHKLADHQGIFASHFDSWKGDIEQVDDVCVIGVRI